MNNKSPITATLAICVMAAALGSFTLFRSADTSVAAPEPGSRDQATEGADHGGGYGAEVGGNTESVVAPATAATITINNFAFEVSGTVQPGQTITVINADSSPHTVTAVDGSFDTGTIEAGQSIQLVVPELSGSHLFFCSIHPSMTEELAIT